MTTSRETAERLGKRKLLTIPPDVGNFDMLRGAYMEDFVRHMYEERLTLDGRDWRVRNDLVKVVQSGPHPDMPWMRASLDGLYEIDGVLVIPDFKAPSVETRHAARSASASSRSQ